MLHVMGIRTWDCRIPGWDFLASPDGLVCLRASLTFGVMGLVQLRGLNGLYRKLASKNPGGLAVAIWLLVAVVVPALLNASLLHVADTGGCSTRRTQAQRAGGFVTFSDPVNAAIPFRDRQQTVA